jgi:autotransporter-associated beta strand protein
MGISKKLKKIKNNEYLFFKMKKTLLFFTAIINFIGFSFFVNAAEVTINGSDSTDYTFENGDILTLKGPANASGKLNFNSGSISISSTDNGDQITGEVNTLSDTDIRIIASSGKTLTISATIGAGSINKDGEGILILNQSNIYTGTTTISDGTLQLDASGTLSDSTPVNVSSKGMFDVNVTNTIASIEGSGIIDIASSTTLTAGDANDKEFSGVIQGAGNFSKSGSGTLTLSGTNTYTGSTTINAGTISVASSANLGATPGSADADNIIFNGGTLNTTAEFTLGANKGITMTGAGTIDTDASTTLTYAGSITDSGVLTKSGTGTLSLSGTSDNSGGISVSAGTLRVSGSGDLGTGSLTIGASGSLDLRNTLSVASLEISGAGSGNRITNGDADGTTANLTVSGTSALNGAVNTDGTQTYSGTTTLGSDVSLTGSTVSLAAISGGTNALAISGNLDLNGAASSLTTLSVSGTSDIGADVTTTGSQTYSGATTFSASSTLNSFDS